jgi:hypothetical protein
MSDLVNFEKIIPVGPKQYAYQQENIEIKSMFSIKRIYAFPKWSEGVR